MLRASASCPSFSRDVARCCDRHTGWAQVGCCRLPCALPRAALAFLLSSWLWGPVLQPISFRPGVTGPCATAGVSQGARSFRVLLADFSVFFFPLFFLDLCANRTGKNKDPWQPPRSS